VTFENFMPSVSENISAGIVAQLWQEFHDWRAFIEGQTHPAGQVLDLIEKFLDQDAESHNIFKQPTRAREPICSFSWQSPNGIWHQGVLYLNGAVYRQAINDYRCHTLLVNDATATARNYPEAGWIRLHELEVNEPHGQSSHGASADLPG
jgi:hypothetical protein